MKLDVQTVKICEALVSLDAKPVIVGGYVRDYFLHVESKDIDIEVFNVENLDDLTAILKLFGEVHLVGKSFGVLKLVVKGYEYDISLPRKETKVAKGHKGFDVLTDSTLSYKQAASRRDFTMNAIGYDFQEKKFLDPYNGIEDIKQKTILHVETSSFIEDPLRVLRAVQFAARFKFKLATNTLKLCSNMVQEKMLDELPKERIFEEYKKLLLKSKKPSLGFKLLDKMNALYPELKALQGVAQDKTYHPEGDVWTHTMMSLDVMAKLHVETKTKKLTLMLAILCHDLGKVETTKIKDGKISSINHENILEPTISFLNRLTDEKAIFEEIKPLIQNHLMPSALYKQKSKNSAIRRLSTRVNIEDLVLLARADHLGRTTEDAKNGVYKAGDWLLEKAKLLHVETDKPKAFLQGRDLINIGMKPSKEFKNILHVAYEAQLDGKINSHEEALNFLKTIF